MGGRFLTAGVMEDGVCKPTTIGTPQGGVIIVFSGLKKSPSSTNAGEAVHLLVDFQAGLARLAPASEHKLAGR